MMPVSVAALSARPVQKKMALHLCMAVLMAMAMVSLACRGSVIISLACRGSCCMFALQMSYFTVGNTTMAVTDTDVSPVGIVCNVTQVCTDAPGLRLSAEAFLARVSRALASSLLQQLELLRSRAVQALPDMFASLHAVMPRMRDTPVDV